MKIEAIPGLSITINIGGMPVTPQPKTPVVAPEVIQKRLENLTKGRKVKSFNSNIYPKPVTNNDTPEGKDLKPKPRMGYYR